MALLAAEAVRRAVGERDSLFPLVDDGDVAIWNADAIAVMKRLDRVDAVVTSPPYLDARPEYGHPTPEWWDEFFTLAAEKVAGPLLLNVGRIWRDGTEVMWWLDVIAAAGRAGIKHHDTLVWVKPNANPIHGKLFANRHEYVLCLGLAGCEFNTDAVRVPYAESSIPRLKRGWTNHTGVKNDVGRRRGTRQSKPHPDGGRAPSYVTVYTGREKGNPHPAPMAEGLAEHLVKLASWPGQLVFDPFGGSGTTAILCRRLGRRCVLAELAFPFARLAAERLSQQVIAA